MSTRSQVKIQGGVNGDAVTLYRHCDGYPTAQLPAILAGYKKSGAANGNWEAARGGKAAAYIIAANIDDGYTCYEPESGHELHGDIEYYYVVTVSGEKENEIKWFVEVYATPLNCESVDQMKLLAKGDIVELESRAQQIEDSENE